MVAKRIIDLAVHLLLFQRVCSAPIFSLASVDGDAESLSVSVADMEKVFLRSQETHVASIARISAAMQTPQAVQVLQTSSLVNSSQLQGILSYVSTQSKKSLRRAPPQYSGLDKARNVLNDMIFESMSNYDQEIAKCTEFYARQCALMEACRGSIAASNFVAANSRALILDAQGNIGKCEKDIPNTKMELSQHNLKCKHELKKLNQRLKIVMGDIAVITMILKMTDCDKKLLQMDKLSMLRCEDQCNNSTGTFVTFNHKALETQMGQLQSSEAKILLKDTFADLFDDSEPAQPVQLVQVDGSDYSDVKDIDDVDKPKKKKKGKKGKKGELPGELPKKQKKARFNNPPLPKTKIPGNPCTDPNKGAPSAANKRAAKCTIKKSPQCYKLQSRFLAIQGGIADERDALMEEIDKLTETCAETKKTLETSIANDEDLLASSQTKLAAATEKEATAGEAARQTAAQNEQLNSDLVKQMKQCSNKYIGFETELCALKKIRGELYKMKGDGHTGFFADCEVSKWSPEACTKKCAGGKQKLTRSVLTHPNGGAKCLPLAAVQRCNRGPCPVSCQLHAWSGWSKCSADCGGGVTQRLRDVKRAMKYGGKPCGETSQTKACNAQACEKDCELTDWTKWSTCSKDCDGGTMKRQRFIEKEAEGAGKCAGAWSKKRLNYKQCNMKRCMGASTMCQRSMDIVLLLDGCPKSGKKAWGAMTKAATNFIAGFEKKPNVAVIQYCGPRTWSGVAKCTGKNNKKVDTEKTCKVLVAQHFTEDMAKVTSVIKGLKMRKGEKLLELALLTAKAELSLGRKLATSIVVTFIDGAPLSPRKSLIASKQLRKATRLLFVPLIKFSPLKDIKTWASRRWQENVVKVSSAKQLARNDVVVHLIANVCPKKKPKLKFGRNLRKKLGFE
jgi:hypothetical protein